MLTLIELGFLVSGPIIMMSAQNVRKDFHKMNDVIDIDVIILRPLSFVHTISCALIKFTISIYFYRKKFFKISAYSSFACISPHFQGQAAHKTCLDISSIPCSILSGL